MYFLLYIGLCFDIRLADETIFAEHHYGRYAYTANQLIECMPEYLYKPYFVERHFYFKTLDKVYAGKM